MIAKSGRPARLNLRARCPELHLSRSRPCRRESGYVVAHRLRRARGKADTPVDHWRSQLDWLPRATPLPEESRYGLGTVARPSNVRVALRAIRIRLAVVPSCLGCGGSPREGSFRLGHGRKARCRRAAAPRALLEGSVTSPSN